MFWKWVILSGVLLTLPSGAAMLSLFLAEVIQLAFEPVTIPG
jgi:hypothetical protein